MAGQLTIDTLKASSGVLATQNGMTGIAKAWVSFAAASGATINASFNVSSISFVSAGIYTINFATAMPNANYVVACSAVCTSSIRGMLSPSGAYPYSTSGVTVTGWDGSTTARYPGNAYPVDNILNNVAIFGA